MAKSQHKKKAHVEFTGAVERTSPKHKDSNSPKHENPVRGRRGTTFANLKRQSYRRRSSASFSQFCWGANVVGSLSDRLLSHLENNAVVGQLFQRLDEQETEDVRQAVVTLISTAFEGLDLRVVCINLASIHPLFDTLTDLIADVIRRPFPLGECVLVCTLKILLQEQDERLVGFITSIKGHVVSEVRGAMRDVVLERVAGRDHVSKAEAVDIWKEAICIRLDEDAMHWMLGFLHLEELTTQEILSPVSVVQLILSDKLEDLIYSASTAFDRKCVHFARVFANSPASLANTGFYAWRKYYQTRARRASLWKGDKFGTQSMAMANSGFNGMIINDQTFDYLQLDVKMVSEAQRVWKQFLAQAQSQEVAGQAIFNAFFESSESVQALFTTPRAVQAMRLLRSIEDLVMSMGDALKLKSKVEVLGFQHLQFDVTIQRVAIFRDAFVHLLELELGDQVSSEAVQGLGALLNYVGGAFIYIREHYRERLRLIQVSWAAVNKRGNVAYEQEEEAEDAGLSRSTPGKKEQQTPSKEKRNGRVAAERENLASGAKGAPEKPAQEPKKRFPEPRKMRRSVLEFVRGSFGVDLDEGE